LNGFRHVYLFRDRAIRAISLGCSHETWTGHTRKLPRMRDGDQMKPSVHRLIPDSSSSNTNTEPEVIILRSESTSLRVTRGMRPRRAASRMSRASPVVSIHPHHGGSGHPELSLPAFDAAPSSSGLDIVLGAVLLRQRSGSNSSATSGTSTADRKCR